MDREPRDVTFTKERDGFFTSFTARSPPTPSSGLGVAGGWDTRDAVEVDGWWKAASISLQLLLLLLVLLSQV